MKLSDVKGERTIEVLADLIEPVANLAADSKVMDMLKREQVPDGMTAKEFFISRVKKNLPSIIKSHKNDVVMIMATIEGTDTEQYTNSLNMAKLVKDVVELFTDEEFLNFLS